MLTAFRKKIYFLIPVKFKLFYGKLKNSSFRMLDVGCGNHSATQTKTWFPGCLYYGLDKKTYNIDDTDIKLMDHFYEIDLVTGSLDEIPDCTFDIIILNHVIEHLPNGLELIRQMAGKLVVGGSVYIEFPSKRSLTLPSVKNGILNFYDDASHVKVYEIEEIRETLKSVNCRIEKAGVRRDKAAIILLPVILLLKWLKRENLTGFGLWDLFGFAEYVYAEKQE